MIYKCIQDFEIPVINENGITTENVLKITSGMIFKESRDNILSGAEIKLENIFNDTFIEISKETLKSLFKEITFADLLELQKQLDEEVAKPRENGFVPRERTVLDIRLALDDEFQEWLRELPKGYNFKTWKKKEYKREDELIEITDCLFFFLQLFNRQEIKQEYWFEWCEEEFNEFQKGKNKDYTFSSEVEYFKEALWTEDYHDCFCSWVSICRLRGFTKDDIIRTYLTKWKRNITVRVKGDWTNEK